VKLHKSPTDRIGINDSRLPWGLSVDNAIHCSLNHGNKGVIGLRFVVINGRHDDRRGMCFHVQFIIDWVMKKFE
jgi:hypothetical protein